MMYKIRNSVEEYAMLKQGERVLVCVSGGADSMCLLKVLMLMQEEYALKLFVIHINHQLRGAESDEDERYVTEFCKEHGIVCMTKRADVNQIAKEKGWTLEEAGRNIRYQYFEEIADELNCSHIAVAHHLDDVAETVLFNMFRGTGIRGMCGIPPVRGRIIRPLIHIERQEIEDFLLEHTIKWRMDQSNLSDEYTRNKIRNIVLSYAKSEINSNASKHIASLSGQMKELYAYILIETKKAYDMIVKEKEGNQFLSVEGFIRVPVVLQKELLMMVIENCNEGRKDITSGHIEDVLSLFYKQSGKQIDISKELIIRREYENVVFRKSDRFHHAQPEIELTFPGDYALPFLNKNLRVCVMEFKKTDVVPKNDYTKWFDYDKINNAVKLRVRNQSDFLQINRDGGSKSIKSLFTDYKIPKSERDHMLLLADGNHILWVPGIRASEGYYVDENTKRILTAELM